jgi:hypothetical protein
MTNKAYNFLIIAVIALTVMCLAKVGHDTYTFMADQQNKPVILQRRVMHPGEFRDQYVNRSTPEYRPPPYKRWMPSVYQQLGVLTGPGGEILPLYGKESHAYRNRWNYYTSTPGNQIYPLPIQSGDRNCTEDIGCNEMYGNEDVSVTGMNGTYKTEIYKNAF